MQYVQFEKRVLSDFCIAERHQIQTSAASSRRGAQLTWFLGWTGADQSPPSHGCGLMCLRCLLRSELHPGVILRPSLCVLKALAHVECLRGDERAKQEYQELKGALKAAATIHESSFKFART